MAVVRYLCRALTGAMVVAGSLHAHDVITTKLTYTRDVSRIFAQHCLSCHGEGTSIPLTNYAEVRPWAVSIKEQVLSRAMPPWGAVPGFGNLAPDKALPEQDMLIIAAWVIGGAPQGDARLAPSKAPAPPPPVRENAPARLVAANTRLTLSEPMMIQGLRPLVDSRTGSVKVVATFPGGRVEPLVWLYGYDPRWPIWFRFAKPLALPAGTEIRSSAPLRFELDVGSR